MEKKKYNKNEQAFDEIIKAAITMDMEEADNTPIPTDEELLEQGYSLPPDDMFDRIKAAAKKEARPKKKNWKKILLVAAIVMIGTVSIFGVLNTSAVRNYFSKTLTRKTDNSIKIVDSGKEKQPGVGEEDAYTQIQKKLGILVQRPKYMPDGMAFNSIRIYGEDQARIDYSDNQAREFRLVIAIIDQSGKSGKSIDTRDGETKKEWIGDKEVTWSYYTRDNAEEQIGAIWKSQEIVYTIKSNIEESELRKVIESFE